MKNIPKIYYCFFACAVIVLGTAIYSVYSTDDVDPGKVPDMFGLSSTECTICLDDREGTILSVWSLPSGVSYSDIEWFSEDPDIATVSGGRVVGQSEGITTIIAKIGGYRDECRVTVTSECIKTQMRIYDAYSDGFDYLLPNGASAGGFSGGLISATFNAGDSVVFALVGYETEWLRDNKDFIGNAAADFSKIVMKLSGSDGTDIVTSTYVNEYRQFRVPFDGDGYSSTANADTAMFSVSKDLLTYGETYEVSFILYRSGNIVLGDQKYDTVSDTFEYCKGNGYRDVSGTFLRAYSWRFGGTGTDWYDDQYIHSFTAVYDYSDYWNGYYKSSKLLSVSESSVRNYRTYGWVYEFSRNDGMIDTLSDELKTSYGGTGSGGQDFAQYVLAFGQIRFDYEYDHIQYYIGDETYSDTVDYWAYVGQTIYSGYGDCEDTAMLIAAVLKNLGFDPALLVLPGHMALAVALEGYENPVNGEYLVFTRDGKPYYFCESTVKSPMIRVSAYGYHWCSYYEGTAYPCVYYLIGMSGGKTYTDSDLLGFFVL